MNIYDVYFKTVQDMCISVEAENEDQAKELFYEKYSTDRSEMVNRFDSAAEYMGFEIIDIELTDFDS